ncbi:hypothetical protein B9Z55_000310 [Caenorhabditis nigoni]|uniref:Uncharacterized protein n=1 Tax=Caenorhabditis nigoni TaxID=1611254 RepID=A0A2G5VNX8_9PELO|nr:hypothetical protein B9Z55_000310 [Caenorhabditis nigoni]
MMGIYWFLVPKIARKKLNLKSYCIPKAVILSESDKQLRLEKAKFPLDGTQWGDALGSVIVDEQWFTIEEEFNFQIYCGLAKDIKEALEKEKTIPGVFHPASITVFHAICSNSKFYK